MATWLLHVVTQYDMVSGLWWGFLLLERVVHYLTIRLHFNYFDFPPSPLLFSQRNHIPTTLFPPNSFITNTSVTINPYSRS